MNEDQIKAFAKKVYGDMAGAMAVGMAYLGVKVGLFRTLAGKGPMRSEQVARVSGLQPRYVEEWLKGMTSAGYLDYDPVGQSFCLSDEHAFLLASEGSDHFMGGLFLMAPVLFGVAPKVAEAFEEGGGVRFEDFGPDCVVALDTLNRGQYEQRFETYWLKALPDIVERLERGGRVLDVGCGLGRVSVVIAKAFPKCEVVGLDADADSIRQARFAAAEAGVGERISFVAVSAGELERGDGFDLIAACDCVHDFAEPHKTLVAVRALLKSDGALLVIEPKAADRLEDNINPLATVYFGFSIFHCMTQSLADGGAGLGTCMGPACTEDLLRKAGFSRFQRLDIKSQTNLFYVARP
ncbi:MAG TPA: class I SAM-dependent methyltransferase [Geminicoccaceae bacterium]|nr:class I SAM-dependent methyltransferase [Geminicoccaceae bacterium]